MPLKPATGVRLADLSGGGPARPMQRLAATVELAAGPQLFILEDATGSGKTEAAILLAARMMAAGLGEGLYIALPTMATANAMNKRLETITPKLFAGGDRPPSLLLSHGRAKLSRALEALQTKGLGDGDGETPASASCNTWIADDRRRAFFADVGVGTIDQAFLAILPKKHLTLRQYALAGRILIVDEAHSFDSYMRQEAWTLLRLHAMNGGSAIVLSATLSRKARRDMAKAFFEGLGQKPNAARRSVEACGSQAYPLMTRICAGGADERPSTMTEG